MQRGGPMMRGRGGMGRGRGGLGMKPRIPFIPHVPFDLVLAEPAFPPVRTIPPPIEEAFQAVRLVQPFFEMEVTVFRSLTSSFLLSPALVRYHIDVVLFVWKDTGTGKCC